MVQVVTALDVQEVVLDVRTVIAAHVCLPVQAAHLAAEAVAAITPVVMAHAVARMIVVVMAVVAAAIAVMTHHAVMRMRFAVMMVHV
ncbi:MAG: hypothetical protein FVQ80_03085 [Planctomycetes bacterium]|nr:hypothetical protein [Planctomycetota bacterium]